MGVREATTDQPGAPEFRLRRLGYLLLEIITIFAGAIIAGSVGRVGMLCLWWPREE